MLVQVNDAVAVGPYTEFHQQPRDPGGGRQRRQRRRRAPTAAASWPRPSDYNPERIILNDWIAGGPTLPDRQRGRHVPRRHSRRDRLQLQQLQAAGDLDARARLGRHSRRKSLPLRASTSCRWPPSTWRTWRPPTRRASSAPWPTMIVNNLQSPDILSIEEIQDNNGTTNDGVVDALDDLEHADQRHPGGRRPDLRLPPDRPGRRPGRRRAGRQHPRRLPVPHRPRAELRRPARGRLRPPPTP